MKSLWGPSVNELTLCLLKAEILLATFRGKFLLLNNNNNNLRKYIKYIGGEGDYLKFPIWFEFLRYVYITW